jgi:hypothetical protein
VFRLNARPWGGSRKETGIQLLQEIKRVGIAFSLFISFLTKARVFA